MFDEKFGKGRKKLNAPPIWGVYVLKLLHCKLFYDIKILTNLFTTPPKEDEPMRSARNTFRIVAIVVVVLIVVALAGRTMLEARNNLAGKAAFWAQVKASQTVMPKEHINTNPQHRVQIHAMPHGSRGWIYSGAIVVGEGGRCFVQLNRSVELNVVPNFPEVELARLEDGTFKATVHDLSLRWEQSNVTGSEKGALGVFFYFPLVVNFADRPEGG